MYADSKKMIHKAMTIRLYLLFELYCIWNRYIKNCATYSHSCSELCSLVFDRTAGDISTSLGRYPWRPLRVCIHSGGQRLGLTWWPWLSVFRECRL